MDVEEFLQCHPAKTNYVSLCH